MIFTAGAVYMGASYGPPAVRPRSSTTWSSSTLRSRSCAIATKSDATMVFGHDPDQIKQLRVAPTGSYR